MSLTKEELENIIPKNGPPINEVSKYIEKYKDDLICLKYGGNIFLDRSIFISFIEDLSILNKLQAGSLRSQEIESHFKKAQILLTRTEFSSIKSI